MTVRIRAVRLSVTTPDGVLGRTITTAGGMTIIRGANSRGKTQIVQAAIYALGMERMLSARANQPLGSALTSEILVSSDGTEQRRQVIGSWVAIELANSAGQVITAQRFVVSDRYRDNLVRVWHGPAITDLGGAGEPEDYFLHQQGAASRERGFHKLLTDLLGWDLPEVTTYTGEQIKLYADVVFPFLIVDQQGWSSAGPRKVDRYQIREPVQRAAEFLIGLSGPTSRMERAQLEADMADLRTRWAGARASLDAAAAAAGSRVDGIPERGRASTARRGRAESTDFADAQLVVVTGNEWVSVVDVLESLRLQLDQLTSARTPKVLSNVPISVVGELTAARAELADLLASTTLLDQDVTMNEAQLAALDGRIATLTEELNRNKDVRTLVRLGSDVATAHLADHNCPTCRQSLEGVEAQHLGPTLDVEETVSLLTAQLNTTRKMRERVSAVVVQSNSTYAALQRQSDQVQLRVRALEVDALAPPDAQSEGDIAQRLTLELRIGELGRARDAFATQLEQLIEIDQRMTSVRARLNDLPEGASAEDGRRLETLATHMRERLSATHFGSYPVDQVRIDPEALRPGRDGFDIDVDVSASDVVRVKVAYLDAIRSISVDSGVHPGLLVLDEPRQQDLDAGDLRDAALLGQDCGSARAGRRD